MSVCRISYGIRPAYARALPRYYHGYAMATPRHTFHVLLRIFGKIYPFS
jgi:hypothetical protein